MVTFTKILPGFNGVIHLIPIPLLLMAQLSIAKVHPEGDKQSRLIKSHNKSDIRWKDCHFVNYADRIAYSGIINVPSDADKEWMSEQEVAYDKIIMLNENVLAAEKVEFRENDKLGFQDYFNGRYFLLNISEVALVSFRDGTQRTVADSALAMRILREVDLNDISRLTPPSELTRDEVDYFARRAYEKAVLVKELLRNFNSQRIQNVLPYFYDESWQVEVSGTGSERPTTYTIRKYLDHLADLADQYGPVNIAWELSGDQIQLEKAAEGYYRETIASAPTFSYTREGKQQQETIQNMQVVVRPRQQTLEGRQVSKWDTFLAGEEPLPADAVNLSPTTPKVGKSVLVTWSLPASNASVTLYQGDRELRQLQEGLSGTQWNWRVDQKAGKEYKVVLYDPAKNRNAESAMFSIRPRFPLALKIGIPSVVAGVIVYLLLDDPPKPKASDRTIPIKPTVPQ